MRYLRFSRSFALDTSFYISVIQHHIHISYKLSNSLIHVFLFYAHGSPLLTCFPANFDYKRKKSKLQRSLSEVLLNENVPCAKLFGCCLESVLQREIFSLCVCYSFYSVHSTLSNFLTASR